MAVAKAAPSGVLCSSPSPTRQPAHPLCGGVDGGPETPLSGGNAADEFGAGVVSGAAAYIAGAGTSGPVSIFVSLSSLATKETRSNPPRLAKASFCAASIPLFATPPGGPPQMPRRGLAHFTAPVPCMSNCITRLEIVHSALHGACFEGICHP
jgi:hypothetical protein